MNRLLLTLGTRRAINVKKGQKVTSDNIWVQVLILSIILWPWENYLTYLSAKLESVHKMIYLQALFHLTPMTQFVVFTSEDVWDYN